MLVNGQVTMRDDRPTNTYSGRPLRHGAKTYWQTWPLIGTRSFQQITSPSIARPELQK